MLKKIDYLPSQHLMMNAPIKWVPPTNPAPILRYQKQNLKEKWIWDLMNYNPKQPTTLKWNYQLSLQINIILPMNNLLLISSNGHFSIHLKIFTCIKIHQTSIFHNPWIRHPSSYLKIAGCHPFSIMPISINKKELYSIQIYPSRKLQHILLYPSTIHTS